MTPLIESLLTATFLGMVIRTATPLLFATLGGLIADLSGTLNVALEGMMLASALTAVITSVYVPWYLAVAAAGITGMIMGGVMAYFHLRLKADIVLVGIAINILASGATIFILSRATGGDKGNSINLVSKAIPTVQLPFLSDIPVVGPALNGILAGHSALSYLALLTALGIWYFLYRMPEGLWLRAVGEYPAAPEAAGITVEKVRAWSLITSGALAGLGGAQLAMYNYIGFTRDMTSGRGFIALGAVLLGARHPFGALAASLLFGLFEALSIIMPSIFSWIPSEMIQGIPFFVALLSLILFSYRRKEARQQAG